MINRTATIIKILILSVITLFVIYLFIYLMRGNSIFINNNKANTVEEMDINEFFLDYDEININAKASNINIKSTYGETIKLSYSGKIENLTTEDNNGVLRVIDKGSECKFFCINNNSSRITLYVPYNYSDRIVINNNYGDVNIGNFQNANIEVNQKYGDVNISGIATARVDNKMGDIVIDMIYDSFDLENNVGDIKIKNMTLLNNSYIDSNVGDIKIYTTNDININADTSLGDVKVNRIHRESDVLLKIHNDVGDIKVYN